MLSAAFVILIGCGQSGMAVDQSTFSQLSTWGELGSYTISMPSSPMLTGFDKYNGESFSHVKFTVFGNDKNIIEIHENIEENTASTYTGGYPEDSREAHAAKGLILTNTVGMVASTVFGEATIGFVDGITSTCPTLEDIDDPKTLENVEKIIKYVEKPMPGYVILSPSSDIKAFAGTLPNDDMFILISNLPDNAFATMLAGLKVIRKSDTESRMKSITERLN
jgi:hypothetical protein